MEKKKFSSVARSVKCTFHHACRFCAKAPTVLKFSPVTVTVRWSVAAVTLLMAEALRALYSANKKV